MKKLILSALLAVAAGVFAAPPSLNRMPQIPPDVRQWQQKLLPRVSPAAKAKVQRAATALLASPAVNAGGMALEQAAATQVSANFPGVAPGSPDVDAIVFLVLSQAVADEQAQLDTILTEIGKINAQKDALRRQLEKAPGMAKSSTPRPPKIVVASAIPPRLINAPPPLPPTATTAQMQAQMDSLSEMSEMDSLLLQMAMERKSKFMSTLSNIVKKLSESASAIIDNLK